MDTVIPRNAPSSQMITQGQEVKKPVFMPTATNAEGNESGVSDTAGLGATAGKLSTGVEYNVNDTNQVNATREPYLNIPASTENLSAKFKNGEGGPAFNPGEYGNNQYQ